MELVKVENNQVVVSSRDIAEHFEKEHKVVLRSIENLKAQNCTLTSMFYETSYTSGTGKAYKEYLMNRDGFCLLVMGFTGTQALAWKLKYINAFNEMEAKLKETAIAKPDSYMIADPVERAKRWIEEEQARQELQRSNELMKPKAEFYDTVVSTESLLSMGDTAKLLDMGVGRNKLFKFLKERKILMDDNMPYQQYVDRGYFKVVESYYMAGDNKVIAKTTYVKQKGVDYIRKLLKGGE